MVFVYPAIISGSVDSKIAPAIAKTLEQYFLLHLQEAIANNDIRIASDWKPRKGSLSSQQGSYGPMYVLTDNRIIKGKSLLESYQYNDIKQLSDVKDAVRNRIDDANKVISHASGLHANYVKDEDLLKGRNADELSLDDAQKFISITTRDISELHDAVKNIQKVLNEVNFLARQIDESIPKFKIEADKLDQNATVQLSEYKVRLTTLIGSLETVHKICTKRLQNFKNDPSILRAKEEREKTKADRDYTKGEIENIERVRQREKEEKEEREKELKQHESHGMYKVEPVKGVSMKPTMANMQVMVNYMGKGPFSDTGRSRSIEGTFKEIAIGVKVLPLKITNFDRIEDFILNDYFTTTFQSMWRRVSRTFLRLAAQKVTQFAHKYFKELEFDPREHMDPVHANILLASQGFINSSPFDKKHNMPSYYNFSSAIVIIDKRDLTKEEGANFFLDVSQLKRMFKMGWNSFCILDETREEALFVSSLDGGHLHVIPYQYIFNNLGMDQVYQNVNDLRKKASPFRMVAGNIGNLIQRLKRESRLLESIRTFKKVK